jgi:hypothetical protein
MSGLDDYRVLWTDPDGDRLCVDAQGWTMSDGSRLVEAVYLPTDHDDKVAVAAAFVDALGLECDGFRAKAEPPSLDQWVHRNLMPHITTHRRYNALTTEEVVAEAFRVATTDPAAFAEFVTFLPLLSFTPAEEPVDFAVPAGWSA